MPLRELFDPQEDPPRYHALVISLIERNRWLNRDAIQAVEKTQGFIDSIGGFVALMDIQRARELVKLNELNDRSLNFYNVLTHAGRDFQISSR